VKIIKISDIKIGDLVYAVGPGHNAPHTSMDLRVYSTPVKNVRLDGSYSASATAADLADAVYAIELGDDRPFLGFAQWTYKSYEIGTKIYLSAADAIRHFIDGARQRQAIAARECERAEDEIRWALAQATAQDPKRQVSRLDFEATRILTERQRELVKQLDSLAQELTTLAGKTFDHTTGFKHLPESCPTCAALKTLEDLHA